MDIDDPVTRPLKAYAFDPSAGKLLGNEMSMEVRYQELLPGRWFATSRATPSPSSTTTASARSFT